MKFKIRIKNGKPVDFQTYTEKEEYTPKFIEIEPLTEKEGFYIETYLDETEVTVAKVCRNPENRGRIDLKCTKRTSA